MNSFHEMFPQVRMFRIHEKLIYRGELPKKEGVLGSLQI